MLLGPTSCGIVVLSRQEDLQIFPRADQISHNGRRPLTLEPPAETGPTRTMTRGKTQKQRRDRYDRPAPAESAQDISENMSSLSIDSGNRTILPVPVAMWVYPPLLPFPVFPRLSYRPTLLIFLFFPSERSVHSVNIANTRLQDFNHCDPKRCSGKKLERAGLIKSLRIGQKFRGIVITPNGTDPVSPADKSILESQGAAVVECSWARIEEIPMARIGGRYERLCHYLSLLSSKYLSPRYPLC